jgi:hypothetical protein
MKEDKILQNVQKIKEQIERKQQLQKLLDDLSIEEEDKYAIEFGMRIRKDEHIFDEIPLYFWDIEKIKEILEFSLNLSETMITTHLQDLNMSVYLQEGTEVTIEELGENDRINIDREEEV